jgi:hypothetical protein
MTKQSLRSCCTGLAGFVLLLLIAPIVLLIHLLLVVPTLAGRPRDGLGGALLARRSRGRSGLALLPLRLVHDGHDIDAAGARLHERVHVCALGACTAQAGGQGAEQRAEGVAAARPSIHLDKSTRMQASEQVRTSECARGPSRTDDGADLLARDLERCLGGLAGGAGH